MFAASIDACKRLFVQQAVQPVLGGDLLHNFHGQLVAVRGDVSRGKDRRQFVLGRRRLIMFSLRQNAQLPQFFIQILHIGGHAGLNHAEVVIFQLLALRRLCAKQGTAGIDQIFALFIHRLIDQEILLFRPDRGIDAIGRCPKQM